MACKCSALRWAGGCFGSDCHTKKDLQALEQKRRDVADLRHIWIAKRQPFMANHLERLAFVEETSVKTNMAKTKMAKTTGWAPRGQRLVDHARFGHWRIQTFVGALRHGRIDAPWVLDGAMNAEMFDLYVTTQLAPMLRKGDVVILDKLSSHKSPAAARALHEIGAGFLFLPPYSPDLNPIEMTFSKLKTLLRKAAARTYDQLWHAVGHVCDRFTDEEGKPTSPTSRSSAGAGFTCPRSVSRQWFACKP